MSFFSRAFLTSLRELGVRLISIDQLTDNETMLYKGVGALCELRLA